MATAHLLKEFDECGVVLAPDHGERVCWREHAASGVDSQLQAAAIVIHPVLNQSSRTLSLSYLSTYYFIYPVYSIQNTVKPL